MFQAQNREITTSTRKVAVSFKISMMTTSVTRPCFTTQHQTCKSKTKTKTTIYKTKTKSKTTACKTKTKTDFFGLRPVLS